MELIEQLKKPLLFSGLNDADLAELAAITVRRTFRKGETLFSEGEEATGFYLLVSGNLCRSRFFRRRQIPGRGPGNGSGRGAVSAAPGVHGADEP